MNDSLNKLYVEITTTCNLDCVMCVRRVWDEPIGMMPRAAFADLMDQVRRLDAPPTIHLSGFGEPTTHPDFLDLVRMAKETGAAVEMTSNGMLLDSDMCLALMELGLNRLVVSVDGASADHFEEIRERASFQRVVSNLQELKRLRIRYRGRHGDPQLVLAFVAMRDNIDDLALLPALATRVGAWDILVSNVVPHTPEMEQQILYAGALNAVTYRASRWAPELSLPKLDIGAATLARCMARSTPQPASACWTRASAGATTTAASRRRDTRSCAGTARSAPASPCSTTTPNTSTAAART